METKKAKSYSHRPPYRGSGLAQYRGKCTRVRVRLQVDALISQVKDLRSKLLRAVICLDLLLSGSKQITILNILYYFLYLTLSSSTLFDGFLTGTDRQRKMKHFKSSYLLFFFFTRLTPLLFFSALFILVIHVNDCTFVDSSPRLLQSSMPATSSQT